MQPRSLGCGLIGSKLRYTVCATDLLSLRNHLYILHKHRKIKLDEKFLRKIFLVKKQFLGVKKKFISFDSKLSEACFESKKLTWSFFGKGGAVEDVFTCVNIRLPRELLFGRENPAAHMTGKVCHMGW